MENEPKKGGLDQSKQQQDKDLNQPRKDQVGDPDRVRPEEKIGEDKGVTK